MVTLLLSLSLFLVSPNSDALTPDQDSISIPDETDADTVLVSRQFEHGSIELERVEATSSGRARGPRMFQTRGSLEYVLRDLLEEKFLRFRGEHGSRQNYALEIRVEESRHLEDGKKTALETLSKELGFTVTDERIATDVRVMEIEDEDRFRREATATVEPGVKTKQTEQNGMWEGINISLDLLAEKLREELDLMVLNETGLEGAYSFAANFNLSPVVLLESLATDYGLTFEREERELPYTVIRFE